MQGAWPKVLVLVGQSALAKFGRPGGVPTNPVMGKSVGKSIGKSIGLSNDALRGKIWGEIAIDCC